VDETALFGAPAELPSHALTGESGLSEREVERRRAEFGPNSMAEPPRRGLVRRIAAQLTDPLVLLLLVAMAITVALRDLTDAIVIALVVVVNTTVGVVQEAKADRAVAALRRLAAPVARVRRDGRERTVPAADVVPGDLIRLDAGDVVPADLLLHEAVRLQIDESTLTGEAEPAAKSAAAEDGTGGASEAHAGTVVVAGRGSGVATRTGAASALGRIAALVAAEPARRTPLQRRLATLSWVLGVVALALSLVVFVAGLLAGRPVGAMLITAISLTVAAVPESLPAVVTVALAMGAHRMAQRSAIVRSLPAVETLGSVTVVAADKTGTLTEGQMTVERLVTADGTYAVAGRGYEPHGEVTGAGTVLPGAADGAGAAPPGAELRRLARDLLLCNDGDVTAPDSKDPHWTPVGDPMEAALVAAAYRCGLTPDLRTRYPRCAEIPFDADRRRMATAHVTPSGRALVICKGAPESVLSTPGLLRDGPDLVARYAEEAERLAGQGYRVLAVADAEHATCPPTDRLEHGLRLAGLIALIDPLRAGAHEVARSFTDAGIRLVLITGDHPATASAVATRLGVAAGRDHVVSGDQLTGSASRVDDTRVFARIRPEQKLHIVRALQQRGHVVAMTGDGVNDAPALRRADIGVAMGLGGTEVARQAGDLVLADDNLSTVTAAVEEGRRIYANVRRFLRYALSGGLAEVLVMIAGPWLGLGVPLLPAQILWVNMLTHGLPGVAMGAEPAERDAMVRPPRRPDEAILGAGLAWRITVTGSMIAVTSLAAALWAWSTGRPWQSVLFTVLGLAQLGVALAVRSRRVPGAPRNRLLGAAVALSVGLQVAAVLLPPLRLLLGTEALSAGELLTCAALGAIPGALLAAARALTTRQSPPPTAPPAEALEETTPIRPSAGALAPPTRTGVVRRKGGAPSLPLD
jgi:Ca2+-transporting ATPase